MGKSGDFFIRKGASLVGGSGMKGHSFTYNRSDGPSLTLVVKGVHQEHPPPLRQGLWLLELEVVQPDGKTRPFCSLDPEGNRLSIPYPLASAAEGYRFTCSSGANGKCLRWGYQPWDSPGTGIQLANFHRACFHLLRADYGGDGRSWTQAGEVVDVSDSLGILKPEPGFVFEAGWSEMGAICIAQPRLLDTTSFEHIAKEIPRLAGRLGPEKCTETKARRLGAILFSRRKPQID